MPTKPRHRRGVVRSAARKLNITVDEYLDQIDAGNKWCTKGRHWAPRGTFRASLSYSDGRSPICDACRTR